MKVYMKPIEMIAVHNRAGKITPYNFSLPGTERLIKISQVISAEEEKLAGNRMIIYRCQSNIDGTERVYELKYEISTCKWFLFKI